ncbi:hypothetical protein IMSAGC019_02543 [Lachnospiraceae bacterium]|nr:hypothetical protein IMSAGC019_02543 [Lachnospiraceae bacterium]
MAIKGAKTIAEYAVRRWLADQNFAMEYFTFSMDGNKGILADANNDTLTLVYDPVTKLVYEERG